jgi:hypothetical protein
MHFIWDLDDDPEGNVQHIAEHGITQDGVEEVLIGNYERATFSESSGYPITFGWTSTGRHIAVVYEEAESDPLKLRPITAYETPPPMSAKRRKKRGR